MDQLPNNFKDNFFKENFLKSVKRFWNFGTLVTKFNFYASVQLYEGKMCERLMVPPVVFKCRRFYRAIVVWYTSLITCSGGKFKQNNFMDNYSKHHSEWL